MVEKEIFEERKRIIGLIREKFGEAIEQKWIPSKSQHQHHLSFTKIRRIMECIVTYILDPNYIRYKDRPENKEK